MAIVLALGAAAFYGAGDFVGGLASRRNEVLAVALGAQLAGLVLLALALPFLGPASVVPTDWVLGGLAGVFGGLGLVVVYRALAAGPMSVVAPTTALSASAVPVLAGLALGERPGLAAVAGIGVSFAAVGLITREGGGAVVSRRAAVRAVLPALGGGAIFGLFFVCLHHTGSDAGMWPLLAARLTSVPLLAVLVAVRHRRVDVHPGVLVAVLASGALDMAANILYLLASRGGMLAVVAAITGLYPAATVVLAQTRLGERLAPVQVAGLAVAGLAAVMVAA
ncbi:MAG TPA: EamA family transporter [Aquihabitans sp.]|nr:EamA family transporter [Aquihabitans sp.]